MTAPAHILAGLIISKSFDKVGVRWIGIVFISLSAILLHGVFDKLAALTFQPAVADFTGAFWLAYHFVVLLVTITFLYLYWNEAKWGILFSLIPDLDWIMLQTQELLHLSFGFYNRPYIHDALSWFLDTVPPFYFLNLLPDLSSYYLATVVEVLFVLALLFIIKLMNTSRRNIHFD